jgi:hypothetical protein
VDKNTRKRIARRIIELDKTIKAMSDQDNEDVWDIVDQVQERTNLHVDTIKMMALEVDQHESIMATAGEPSRATLYTSLGILVVIAALLGFFLGNFSDGDDPHAHQQAKASMLLYAQLNHAVNSLLPVQHRVAEFHQATGRYPFNLQQVGMQLANVDSGSYIQSVELNNSGVIIADLGSKFPPNTHLAMMPRIGGNGVQAGWQCATDLPVAEVVPDHPLACEVRKPWPF